MQTVEEHQGERWSAVTEPHGCNRQNVHDQENSSSSQTMIVASRLMTVEERRKEVERHVE